MARRKSSNSSIGLLIILFAIAFAKENPFLALALLFLGIGVILIGD